jgi:hypothetical protein
MDAPEAVKPTLRSLWAQYLPLALSDVTMSAGDPLIASTLAHMPDTRPNLAAAGVAKAVAACFESPILMLLHTSTALSASAASREALWRFMLVAITVLTAGLTLVVMPAVFGTIAGALGVHGVAAERTRTVLLLLVLWPAAIGWRRYFQGQLIRAGRSAAVAHAGLGRLAVVATVLAIGWGAHAPGHVLAGSALAAGVLSEAAIVTWAAWREARGRLPSHAAHTATKEAAVPELPTDVAGVWRFYWPLANAMLVVWGGRLLLVALVARAIDGPIALAAWSAAWGLVLLTANATRMVQQVILRQRGRASDWLLMTFALSVGLACSAVLLALAATPPGRWLLGAYVGHDAALTAGVLPVVGLCVAVPLVVAMQNAVQGFLIGQGRTGRVNVATWLGTGTLLATAALAMVAGWPGATGAAGAMMLALSAEAAWLALGLVPPPRAVPAGHRLSPSGGVPR